MERSWKCWMSIESIWPRKAWKLSPLRAPGERVRAEHVYELAADAVVIIGPGPGLDAKLFAHAPLLRVIGSAASGYEAVDIDAATRAGVAVVNAPAQAGSEAVADLAFGLMLSVARDIPHRHQLLISEHRTDRTMGLGLWDKTLGIIGLGSIGQATALAGDRIQHARFQLQP